MTATTGRLTWLSKLLGQDKAADVIADTRDTADVLDGAGVERKEMKPEEEHPGGMPMMEGETPPMQEGEAEPEPAAEEEEKQDGDPVAAAGAKLAQVIIDAESANGGKPLTQEQYAAVIAEALRPAVEAEAEPAPEAPPAEAALTEQPQQEDTGKAAPEPVTADADAHEAAKALNDLLGQMLRDQGEMAKAYQPLVEQVSLLEVQLAAVQTELAEAKALKPIAEQLAATVEELKARLADRPRQASQSEETALGGDEDMIKAVESAIKKGVNGNTKLLGIRVKD